MSLLVNIDMKYILTMSIIAFEGSFYVYGKTASKCNRKYPTNTNALKLKKAQNELANIYLKEQSEYIQNQIDKIRASVEDRQSRIAWKTMNEVSRRKSTAKAKLKATSQQD